MRASLVASNREQAAAVPEVQTIRLRQTKGAEIIMMQDIDPNVPDSPLPRYESHKKVWALKIQAITLDRDKAFESQRETDGSATIIPAEDGYAPFKVDHEYLRKHDPQVGGYYVVYEDGYKSFSPAAAFENGYTRSSND